MTTIRQMSAALAAVPEGDKDAPLFFLCHHCGGGVSILDAKGITLVPGPVTEKVQ
jgi:hypothetical protein